MSYLSPITPYDSMEDPELKDLTDEQRTGLSIIQSVVYVICIAFAVLICGMCFGSCSTPKAVEEHHHHHYEADSAAVHQLVDRQLTSWHEEMTQYFNQKLEQYSTSSSSSEQQKEIISELITVTTDSLGREVRQEQRTISRDITRELQQQEQRITQEYEARLHAVVDSLNDTYQQRYDSLSARVSQMDSTFVKKTPVGDTRPWYQRLWDNIRLFLIGIVIALVIWLTRSLWWPPLKRLV